MNEARLIPPALAFVAGIAAELRGFAMPLLLAVAALSLAPRLPRAFRFGATGALALGTLVAHFHGESPLAEGGRPQLFEAAVVAQQPSEFDGTELTLKLDDGRQVRAFAAHAPLQVGQHLEVHGTFEPLDEPRNPGEPSARELGAERGIDGQIERARIVRSGAVDENDPALWLPRARSWAAQTLRRDLPEPDATILAGALWGERGSLPPDLRAEFQDTGTVHVLVTAGLHLGVVAWITIAALRAAGCGRVTSSLVALGLIWLYAAFTGAHVPSLRAATMLSFALVARATGREALNWNALAAAAIVTTALRPVSVVSLSFALSFSCVASILLFAKTFAVALERYAIPAFAREALALTFSTQLGTWPLTASAFLVFAPYAALANACVIPAIGAAMLGGFCELAAAPIPVLVQGVANVETSLLDWIVTVVRTVAALPGAHVVTTPPPVWTIAFYDLALLGTAALLHVRRRIAALALIALATACCLWPPRLPDRRLRVIALDVGQADALLVQTPKGRTLLVDAGGRLERGPQRDGDSQAEAVGERVVVPFLVRAGIHHLDAIVLSHPHGDHAGGIAPVLRALGAEALADSGQAYLGHAYLDGLAAARQGGTVLLEPRAGEVWQTADGVTFRFYGPRAPYLTGTRNDINNNSLVFRLEYGTFRMLFTGDAESEAERRILASGVDLRADVLKVGHHGSAYGTTPAFVRAVAPRVAIVSVGRHNLFGHPARQTLQTLRDAGAAIYRTDEDGAVSVATDGASIAVTTMLPVREPLRGSL